MKRIRFLSISFTEKHGNRGHNDCYEDLQKQINIWYEKNQDVEIVSVNMTHEQLCPTIKGFFYLAHICFIRDEE